MLPTCCSELFFFKAVEEHTAFVFGMKLCKGSQHLPPAKGCAVPPASITSTTCSPMWLHVPPKRLKHGRDPKKTESPSALKRSEGFKLIKLAVFSALMHVFCMKKEEVRTFPYVVKTICFKLPFSRTRGFEHQIQTDTLKESKQIYVKWQHHSSDSGKKTLLLAPYFTGAFCTAG